MVILFIKATKILLYCKIEAEDYASDEVLITGMEIKQQDYKFT